MRLQEVILILLLIYILTNKKSENFADVKNDKIKKINKVEPGWDFSFLDKFPIKKINKKDFSKINIPYNKVGFKCLTDGDCGAGYGTNKYFCNKGNCAIKDLYK